MAEDAGNTSVCAVLHSEFPNGLQEERIYREPVKMVTFTRQVSKIEDPTEKLCCIPQARAFEQALDAFEQAPEAEPTNGQNRAAILSAAVRTAVMQGKAEDLRWLLREYPAQLEARDPDPTYLGATAFLHACSGGRLECVEVLVAARCNTSVTTDIGGTGLMLAACAGHRTVVDTLLTLGEAELNKPDITGQTAFYHACITGDAGCVEALVCAGCDTALLTNGRTGLQRAQILGHTGVVELLERLDAEQAVAARRAQLGRLVEQQDFGAAGLLLTRMLRETPANTQLLVCQADLAAARAEAETKAAANATALLAELEVEERTTGGGLSKSQKKKEKQRRKKQARAAAATAAATPDRETSLAAPPPSPLESPTLPPPDTLLVGRKRRAKGRKGGGQQHCTVDLSSISEPGRLPAKTSEPEPELQPELKTPAVVPTHLAVGWEPDTAVAALLRRLGLGVYLAALDLHEFDMEALMISTPADLEEISLPVAAAAAIVAAAAAEAEPGPEVQEPELEPELELEPEPELVPKKDSELEKETEPILGMLVSVPMVDFDEAKVQCWLAAVPGLTEEQKAIVAGMMEEEEYDGSDLVHATTKTLRRRLKDSDGETAVPLLLAARDAHLTVAAAAAVEVVSAAAVGAAIEEAAAPSCQICLEPYGEGVVPRMLVACGHSFCEDCLATMLRCATSSPAQGLYSFTAEVPVLKSTSKRDP
jgi:hypothetical protein